MVTPDALLAEMRRVLEAVEPPRDAHVLLTRLERSFGGGNEGGAKELLEVLRPSVERAFPGERERERLLDPLELALLERRYGDYGVICVRGEPPRGWRRWSDRAARVLDEPYEGSHGEDMARGYIAVRRGWGTPDLLVTRRAPQWSPFLDALVVPETATLFVGARDRVVVFSMENGSEPVEHDVMLFWSMARHRETLVVVAEISVRGFGLDGAERWDVFADPPHDVHVEDGVVVIHEQLTGHTKRHRLEDGSAL